MKHIISIISSLLLLIYSISQNIQYNIKYEERFNTSKYLFVSILKCSHQTNYLSFFIKLLNDGTYLISILVQNLNLTIR